MKNMKKAIVGCVSAVTLFVAGAVTSSAATVDLPDAFSDLSPIIEAVLTIIEFISKIFSFLS